MRTILIAMGTVLLVLNSTAAIAGFPSCQGIKDTHCKSAIAGDQYQCTTYVQQNAGWPVGKLGTTLDAKRNRINCEKPKAGVPGSVVVISGGQYGHVGLVREVKGDTITIADRNLCCDGRDRQYNVSITDARVLGFIVKDSNSCYDARGSSKYGIRISNIDDEGTCKVNGDTVKTVGYYQDTQWVDITNKLRPGKNEIKFKVLNKGGGYTYHFGIQKDGKTIWEEKCGDVGKKSCTKKKLGKGDTLTKTYELKM